MSNVAPVDVSNAPGSGADDAKAVGMQNAGMASGLAISVLKSPLAALPPAVFGPWMNMSGAVLAYPPIEKGSKGCRGLQGRLEPSRASDT